MKGNYFEASFFVILSTERGFSHLVRIPENAVPSPSKPLCILMCFILGAPAQSQKSLWTIIYFLILFLQSPVPTLFFSKCLGLHSDEGSHRLYRKE